MKRHMFFSVLFFCFVWSYSFALEPILVVYGAPGSGKGTFSQYLKEHHGYNHVSSGDLIRYEIDHETPLGKKLEEVVKQGNFIDQEIIHNLMRRKVIEFLGQGRPFIIDGFAKSEASFIFLNELFCELDLHDQVLVVYLEASDAMCVSRLLNRSVCSDCGHVYNGSEASSMVENVCDLCGGLLKIRLNDDDAVIKKRLALYRSTVQPTVYLAKDFFPFVVFNTDISLKECLERYQDFMFVLQKFHGSVREFTNTLDLSRDRLKNSFPEGVFQ